MTTLAEPTDADILNWEEHNAHADQADDDQAEEHDLEAPYGRKADGTPRRKPGPAPGAGRTMPPPGRRRATRRAGTAARPRSKTSSPTAADDPMVRGAQALIGLPTRALAMAGMAVGMASRRYPEGSPERQRAEGLGVALSADACTLIANVDGLATGLASLHGVVPGLAGVLLKANQVGPYAAILEAATRVGLQVLTNHGVLPPMAALGTVDPAELVAQMMGAAASG